MGLPTALLVHATVGAAGTLSFAYAARAVLKRRSGTTSDGAHLLLAVFWAALSLLGVSTTLGALGVALGGDVRSFGTATLSLSALLIPLSLWAVSSYLSYVVRGTHASTVILGVLYAFVGVAFFGIVGWIGPPETVTTAAGVHIAFPNPLPRGVSAAVILFSVLPIAAMAFTYVLLLPRLDHPYAKRRAWLLAAAFGIWTLKSANVIATMDGAALDGVAMTTATLLLGLLPSGLVVLAYLQEKTNEQAGLGTPA